MSGASSIKIATFNVNSLRKRFPIVLDWLAKHQPDVLCLQETKVQDTEFPLMDLHPSGYQVTFRGMKAYNGVAILTKQQPEQVWYGFDDGGEPDEARLLRILYRGIPRASKSTPPNTPTSWIGTSGSAATSPSTCLPTSRRSGAAT
jgi:exodeoxyribonuclease III